MKQHSTQILLVGTGPMAIEYTKVLQYLKHSFIVIGRGKTSAKLFEDQTHIPATTGGIEKLLNLKKTLPQKAIVAVSEENLGIVTRSLINAGIKSILVEKPAGLDFTDIKKVAKLAEDKNCQVFIGYNRRFYSSVKEAQRIIKQDGGLSSIFIDFTEASFRIEPLHKAKGVKGNWFLQNSTHIIDLAFFLAGAPKKLCTYTSGKLSWHPKAAKFAGSGQTNQNVLFSYIADWSSPGRWNIELMTKKHKLILKPLEKLQIQPLGSFEVKEFPLKDTLDIMFKPGLFEEVKSFLGNKHNLCTIEEQIKNLQIYSKILNG